MNFLRRKLLLIINSPVEKAIELDNQIFLLKIYCPEIIPYCNPGQFLNLRVTKTMHPLLSRPFSVCDIEGDYIYIMFNIFGEGTKILSRKEKGDMIDILGPLGKGFNYEGDYDTAIIVGGGLGAAPFPFLTRKIGQNKNILTFIGGRTHRDVITHGMNNISISTDDGSLGLKGNVIDLLKLNLEVIKSKKSKMFACGPNAMLRALKEFCINNDIDCEASTECAMACGFGICQGCPIESAHHPEKYYLVCKDGPVFNVKDVVI
jgi:dihydroorotate dehydrogenase electron transfer subunit